MELYRSFYNKLLDWKNTSQGSTALLIEGARRVGKSCIAEKFAKENYRSYLVVDFAKATKEVRDNFETNLSNLDVFFQVLSLEYATTLYPRESLIIFDEVQLFPKARQAIKYLVADGRYDFLETGSLISLHENVKDILIPSEEEKLRMYPLTFPEFLIAAGEEPLLDYIRQCYNTRQPLIDSMHKRASRLIREYMLVGGMPQSVVAYFDNARSFEAADWVKRNILNLYKEGINKTARRYRSKVATLFDFIPGYLSTHEKRVMLSRIDRNGQFDRYDEPLFWLKDSMICNLCYKSTDPSIGLALSANNSAVKCYMGDTGLLVSLAFSPSELSKQEIYRKTLAGSLALNEGMLHENLAAQTLASAGLGLFFYTHYSVEKHRNDIEIDFLLASSGTLSGKINPVEIKSSKSYKTVSLDKFKERFGKRVGRSIIVHPKQLAEEGNLLRIPTYMLFCVAEELEG